jgi:RNA polymerase sigma-70 factor (ECF subfamily)
MKFFRQKSAPATLTPRKSDASAYMDTSPRPQEWRGWLAEQTGRLLLFARQQTRSHADAEDVLQEAVVEAWRKAGGVAPPPLALVFATIRRRAIDLARRNERRRQREAASDPGDVAWFDPTHEDTETRDAVEAGMKTLPDIYREVVTLKIWGELTFEEIAQVLEVPANTAASRYRYGLEALRKTLKGLPV